MATKIQIRHTKIEIRKGKIAPASSIHAIRQPIVTVAGHVDHGKTTILDKIRGTCQVIKEPGRITQKISFTVVPRDVIRGCCKDLLDKYKIGLEILGFLFIDTPGHAAFTNIRKRGGALADLAILVVDINEGIMEQTKESIEVLKASKVPFIVALNKIDAITGWRKMSDNLVENIEKQSKHARDEFDKKAYQVVNSLTILGFDNDLFFRVGDFTKQIALVPCSGKTGEGISELLVMLAGLAQRFLKGKLEIGKEGRGTVLEVKREKGIMSVDAILYDGKISKNSHLVITTFTTPIVTKIRALLNALPCDKGFEAVDEVNAAAGIRLNLATTEDIIPGTSFVVTDPTKPGDVQNVQRFLQKEMKQTLHLDSEGIIAKADSLGSLEALLFLLRKSGIQVKKAEIGSIKNSDITMASTTEETMPLNAVIAGFNVEPEADIKINENVKIITGNVIYHIIEALVKWRKEKQLEIERDKLASLTMPGKIKLLPNACFRQSNPAIFGIKVEAGTIRPGVELINENGEEIDKIKGIQSESKSVEKALQGQEIAISLPNTTYGRQIKENQVLYIEIKEEEFRKLKENKKYLTASEISVLQEIANIKRKAKATWGI